MKKKRREIDKERVCVCLYAREIMEIRASPNHPLSDSFFKGVTVFDYSHEWNLLVTGGHDAEVNLHVLVRLFFWMYTNYLFPTTDSLVESLCSCSPDCKPQGACLIIIILATKKKSGRNSDA